MASRWVQVSAAGVAAAAAVGGAAATTDVIAGASTAPAATTHAATTQRPSVLASPVVGASVAYQTACPFQCDACPC